jgi:hypothetical protein
MNQKVLDQVMRRMEAQACSALRKGLSPARMQVRSGARCMGCMGFRPLRIAIAIGKAIAIPFCNSQIPVKAMIGELLQKRSFSQSTEHRLLRPVLCPRIGTATTAPAKIARARHSLA